MKLSPYTQSVLKNFAGINTNQVFNAGDRINTIAPAKNILSSVKLDIQFPEQFGVYDLNEFLNVVSLVDEPEIKFEDKYAVIGDSTGRTKIKYFFTDIDMLIAPDDKMIDRAMDLSDFEVEFTLDADTINRVKRAQSALGHQTLSITSSDGAIALTVTDKDNVTSNSFTIEVPGKSKSENFNFMINLNNLRIIQGDYEVGISSKMMSRWNHTEQDIIYWIACEKTSEYGE